MYFFGVAGSFLVGAVCAFERAGVFSDAREVLVVLLAMWKAYGEAPTSRVMTRLSRRMS
jgi:hypothetical protein